MYKSFSIKNYRCFKNLTIEPLAQINLISGKNNVGKTALLEAIFIFSRRHPVVGVIMYALRRLEDYRIDDELMSELFRNFHTDKIISLSSEDATNNKKMFLDISLQQRNTSRILLSKNGEIINGKTFSPMEAIIQENSNPIEILFEYRDDSGENIQQLRAFAEGGEVKFDGLTGLGKPKVSLSLPRNPASPRDIAQALSDLRIKKKHHKIVEILQIVEERLEDVEVLQRLNNSVIYCTLHNRSHLMPLPLMGEGIERLLEIALTISHSKDGIVLIDEIENGLHHSVMPKIWQAIGELAHEFNVQIFATTHSWECIDAAHQAFAARDTYDFLFHRLDRHEDTIEAVTYEQDTLDAALEMGWEIRA